MKYKSFIKIMLEKEYRFFQENLENLVLRYENKFIIIKDSSIEGVFDSYNEALAFALKKFKIGSFLIQECIKENESIAHFLNSNLLAK